MATAIQIVGYHTPITPRPHYVEKLRPNNFLFPRMHCNKWRRLFPHFPVLSVGDTEQNNKHVRGKGAYNYSRWRWINCCGHPCQQNGKLHVYCINKRWMHYFFYPFFILDSTICRATMYYKTTLNRQRQNSPNYYASETQKILI